MVYDSYARIYCTCYTIETVYLHVYTRAERYVSCSAKNDSFLKGKTDKYIAGHVFL